MRKTSLDPGVRLFLTLACVNFAVAGGMGVLLGLNRVWPLLGGATIGVLYAHAHLAAIGWAMMLALGVGCRVLPMVIPARPTKGRRLVVTACLIEAGLVVLVPSLVLHSDWMRLGAVLISAGLVSFVVEVVRMVTRRLPPNREIRVPFVPASRRVRDGVSRRRDRARPHARMGPLGPDVLPVAFTYGILGLLGFLGQLIAAVQGRMSPLFAWYWVSLRRGPTPPLQTPYALPAWRGEAASAALWIAASSRSSWEGSAAGRASSRPAPCWSRRPPRSGSRACSSRRSSRSCASAGDSGPMRHHAPEDIADDT